MKKVLGLVLATIFLLTEAGCVDSVEKTMRVDGDDALAFVSEKYHRSFEPIAYEDADYLSETDRVHCYTEGMDSDNEHVEIYVTRKDAKTEYHDNYFGFYVRPQAEAYLGGMVAGEFSEYKVFRDDEYMSFPNELTCESTLDDLYRMQSNYLMNAKIYVKGEPGVGAEEYLEKACRIEKKLSDSGRSFYVYLFVVSDDAYQTIDRYAQDDFWRFYAEHRDPDGEKYYYAYTFKVNL